jgi:ribosomal-protein-serine acetyltransferase
VKIIIDDSLNIRLFEHNHADDLFNLTINSKESVGKWLEFPNATKCAGDSLNFIERVRSRYNDNNGFWAGIWNNGELVGSIGLLFIDWENKKTEIGYWLGTEYEGRGFATRSCQALIDQIFNEMQLNRIEINVKVGNKRSKLIPKRLGFQLDGVLRQSELFDGQFHDVEVYSLLFEDWKDKL